MLRFNILQRKLSGILPVALVSQGVYSPRKTFVRTLTLKYYKTEKKKPAPFPYKEKVFRWYHFTYDLPKLRFDENTKLIVVDGPVCSHKDKVARTIANAFDLHYIPQPTLDACYINSYGFDLRTLDDKLPESVQSYDEKKFNLDPSNFNAAAFQFNKYKLRWIYYLEGLKHILNTGQGVVTVRSPFSDFVFAEAMYQNGYMSLPAKEAYYNVVRHTIHYLLRPHLIVYLDNSPEKTLENIKKRGEDFEINSKALNLEFLQSVDVFYRDRYIEEARFPCEVLMYDNFEEDDIEEIIEDIEVVNLEEKDRHRMDPKFQDWRVDETYVDLARLEFTTHHQFRLYHEFNIDAFDVPELYCPAVDFQILKKVYAEAPGGKYESGYNPDRADNVAWKWSTRPKSLIDADFMHYL